ncbi:MAG: type II toxin-antitoxin system VapC family toxin [Microthrixaceae bacterium]
MIATVDTSALAKLLVEEAESPALRTYLQDPPHHIDEWAISAIATTELRRLALRLEIDQALIEPVITPFRVVRLTDGMLQLASRLPQRNLGTLDAIHIATALSIGAGVFVSYDDRQLSAARAEDLAVVTPGHG